MSPTSASRWNDRRGSGSGRGGYGAAESRWNVRWGPGAAESRWSGRGGSGAAESRWIGRRGSSRWSCFL